MAKRVAFGTILSVQYAQSGSYIDIANLGDTTGPETSVESVDVTTHDSADRFNESLPGMADGGEVSYDLKFDSASAAHQSLYDAVAGRAIHNFYLKLPGWVSTGGGGYWSFAGFFTKFAPGLAVKGSVDASMTVKVTGKPVFHKFA